MRHGGPFAEGGNPDDLGDGGDELPLRGWVPPDDRLWRHPSELDEAEDLLAGTDDGPPTGDADDVGLGGIDLGGIGFDETGLEVHGLLGDPTATGAPGARRSRSGSAGTARRYSRRPSATPQSVHRQPPAVLGLAAVVMAVAMVVFVADRLAVTHRTGSALTADATSLTTDVIPASQVAATVASVRSSLVGLVVTRRGHAQVETGVAMTPGDLVVTSLRAVAGASKIVAITPKGRRLPARLLGSDPTSGVSVVRVRGRVAPARFADSRAQAGQLAIAECLCQTAAPAKRPDVLKPTVAVARVEAVGVGDGNSASAGSGPVPGNRSTGPATGSSAFGAVTPSDPRGPTVPRSGSDRHDTTAVHGLLDAVESDYAPLAPDPWGSVLVNGNGQVAGILASRTENHGERFDVFVPGWLADTVASRLARDHRVVHGWLGVTGATDPTSCGAVVKSVLPGAPAEQVLTPGDVVSAVDGRAVCNWSELQAALYVISPGQPVHLSVDDAGRRRSVTVQLSASPG
ncbi:MAG: S1C family serine protease [Actinomycetota bacterium]|jgi:S1-C subfamily serine protease|nr:S1C family serine protease [Actinomycetota bacterium]